MTYLTRIAWRTVLAVGLLTGPALGQQFPFTGVINAENVNIRAGAGKNYYAVTQLDSGALLRVYGNLYGWYEIGPPRGTFAYVAKRAVKRDGDGAQGVFREDRVRIRAPSPAGPEKSYRRQTLQGKKGDRVKILGEAGEFYKIESPAETRLFVNEQFVEEATEAQIAAAGQQRVEASGKPQDSGNGASDDGGGDAASAEKTLAEAAGGSSSSSGGNSLAEMQREEQQSAEASAGGESGSDSSATETAADEGSSGSEPAKAESDSGDSAQKTAEAQAKREMKADASGSGGGGGDAAADSGGGQARQAEGDGGSPESRPAARRSVLPDPAEVALEELPVRPRSDRLTQLERQYIAVSRRPLMEQPVGPLRMAYEKALSEADLSRGDRALAEARVTTLETRQELKASLEEISAAQREMTEAEKKRQAEDAKKPPRYIAVGRLTTSTLYTGEDQPLLYRVVNPLTQRTAAYVRPGGEDGPDVRDMLGQYVGIEGETQYDEALKLHVIAPENVDELSASEGRRRSSAR